jgi:peptide/nickel transport system substrate-binding protein
MWGDGDYPPLFVNGINYYPVNDADFALQWMQSDVRQWYSNPRFDELFKQSRTEIDKEKRRQLFYEMAEVLREDPPALFLYQPSDLTAMATNIDGFQPRSDLVIWFDSITKTE